MAHTLFHLYSKRVDLKTKPSSSGALISDLQLIGEEIE